MTWSRPHYTWYYDHIQSRVYDAGAKCWFLPLGGEAKVRRALIDAVGLGPGTKILDMCCGTGGATYVARERVGRYSTVVGVDLSRGQLRRAAHRRRHSNVHFALMDAAQAGLKDDAFDAVLIPHALHEMTRAGRLAVLREARRVVAVGGPVAVLEMDEPPSRLRRLALAIWWYYWLPFNPETPTRRDMLRHGLRKELAEAGFAAVTRRTMFDGALQVVVGRKEGDQPFELGRSI
jgi:demethylmenaquinone methyltransferase/2-methoxy-6-polyprenyl-1,4-benzoquinol methylase